MIRKRLCFTFAAICIAASLISATFDEEISINNYTLAYSSVAAVLSHGVKYNGDAVDSSGTGFFVDSSGLMITSLHALLQPEDFKTVQYTIVFQSAQGDKEYPFKIIKRDWNNDVALIKVESKGKFTPLDLGDNSTVSGGSILYLAGYPLKLGFDFVRGSVRSTIPNSKGWWKIQADANFGSSGGPAINSSGRVVGMIASGLKSFKLPSGDLIALDGYTFLIPIDNIYNGVLSGLKIPKGTSSVYSRVDKLPKPEMLKLSYNVELRGNGIGPSGSGKKSEIFILNAAPGYKFTDASTSILAASNAKGIRAEIISRNDEQVQLRIQLEQGSPFSTQIPYVAASIKIRQTLK